MELSQLIRALADRLTGYDGENRRAAKRTTILKLAEATLLDNSFQPTHEPMEVVVRDFSTTGVSVLFYNKVGARFVKLDFGEEYDNATVVFTPIREDVVKILDQYRFQLAGPFVISGLEKG